MSFATARRSVAFLALTAFSVGGAGSVSMASVALLSGCGGGGTHVVGQSTDASPAGLQALVARAEGGDANATAALRAQGEKGLAAVLAVYDDTTDAARREKLRPVIDAVAKQRDAHVSRLYWHTNLVDAEAAARATGRPILALQLLGNLDEELSCANSRFFRTTLYANREVADYLRTHYVLVWQSERPAPTITIDYRDGRKVVRTITGNSIHYVLDEDGRPVDALPGLYGPQAWMRALQSAEAVAIATRGQKGAERQSALERYHRAASIETGARYAKEVAQLGLPNLPPPPVIPGPSVQPPPGNAPPPALVAMPIAPSKAMVEMRPLRAILPGTPPVDLVPWSRLALLHRSEAHIDEQSRELIRRKNPRNWSDAKNPGRPLDAGELAALYEAFETSMAEDTAKNELGIHANIHRWFLEQPLDLGTLNRHVYDALFSTPASDPWLGLVPPNAYTGLTDDGIKGK
jgi:hypothetical protein